LDPSGNLYVTDYGNSVIRVVSNGIIKTFAGDGTFGYSGDGGPATSAQLKGAKAVAVDADGNVYIAEEKSRVIRKVNSGDGAIATFAGNGTNGYSGDGGPATDAQLGAQFYGPSGLAFDADGNLFIADTQNSVVRKVSTDGVITTVAGGRGGISYPADGLQALAVQLTHPTAVAISPSGELLIADGRHQILKVSSSGVLTRFAGRDGCDWRVAENVPATLSDVCFPAGIVFDPEGNAYLLDSTVSGDPYSFDGAAICGLTQVVDTSGIVRTIAGGGSDLFLGDGISGTEVALASPTGVAAAVSGGFLIADGGHNRIRMITGGSVATVAGVGNGNDCLYLGDGGPAAEANFCAPFGLAIDPAGDGYYISDSGNNVVRKVSGDGTISTVAGNGFGAGTLGLRGGYSGDGGRATRAELWEPYGIAVSPSGDLYIADLRNNVVRKVSKGIITTVAGIGGYGAYSGDGGPAMRAQLNAPAAVALDGAGNLYIADSYNNAIRKVSTDGTITTVAGDAYASQAYTGASGPALAARLNHPSGIALDAAGNLYIADSANHVIRKVSGDVITTIAGTGRAAGGALLTNGYSGDGGPATSGELNWPQSIFIDAAGSVFFADSGSKCREGAIASPRR
jgi:trimeric autotransporter adhesin